MPRRCNTKRAAKLKAARRSTKYFKWQCAVNKNHCEICGVYYNDKYSDGECVQLVQHHLKSFAKYPRLRYSPSNGMTVCKRCHIKLHSKKE